MSTNAHTADKNSEPNELDDRTRAALEESMVAFETAPGQYTVVGQHHGDRDQDEYTVDLRLGVCSCSDYEYRQPEGGCKHVRRVKFATGETPIPAGIENVDPALGQATDDEVRRVATDGGQVATADKTPGDRQRVPVSGGVLVFEARELGKELVGFEDVTDWDDLADALAAKGHDRGAIFHLPELDA